VAAETAANGAGWAMANSLTMATAPASQATRAAAERAGSVRPLVHAEVHAKVVGADGEA